MTTHTAPEPIWRRRRRLLDPGAVGIVLGLAIGALLWWGFTASGARPAVAALPADPTPAPVSAPPPATPDLPRAAAVPAPAGPWVQLAALRSEREADATWQALRGRHAALLGEREPHVLRFLRGSDEFFRLRVGPFASRAEASALCDSLRRAGEGCFVASED